MGPQQQNSEYQPKWRHFHPQSTVWVQNILTHDVVYQVADEHNNAFQYRLPAGKVSELPGGPVATLGVKAIVDELIQNNKNDVLRIYEPAVRAKYEEDIILRVKEAPQKEAKGPQGEINLGVDDSAPEEEEEELVPEVTASTLTSPEVVEEVEFPAVQEQTPAKAKGSKVADKVAEATTQKLQPAQTIEE